jgi:putative transposase
VTIESDVSIPNAHVRGRAIGIDLGLERFLTVSDGSSEERPKFFKSMQGKLKLLQRSSAKKQKGSKNREKALTKVARMHNRISNRRKDFHLKTAHKLCDQAQTIIAEDLNVKGLTRGMLRKDCADAAFGQFLSLLEWVCFKRGAFFLKVNPHGTSQTCPSCLAAVSKDLAVREHHCQSCGYHVRRDHAAAEMVLIRGLEQISSQGLWRTETACQVGLSGVPDLDKWRGAGMSDCEVGSPRCTA